MLDSVLFDYSEALFPSHDTMRNLKLRIEAAFERYLKSNNMLKTIVFRGSITHDIYDLFKLVEKYIPSLKYFQDISLMVFSFTSKENFGGSQLPYFFKSIKNLRVIKSSGNTLVDTLLENPKALENLVRISIDIANCSEKNFSFLSQIQKLQSLKALHLKVHSGGKSMIKAFLSSVTVPKDLSEFVLHLHDLKISELIQQENISNMENPFETVDSYTSFLDNIKSSEDLKTLEIKLFSLDFKEYYTEFFSGIFSIFYKLEHLRFKVIECSSNIQHYSLQEAFQLDSFLKKQGPSLMNLKELVVCAPKMVLKYIPNQIEKFELLTELNIGNRIEGPENSRIFTKFLEKIQPKQTMINIGLGKETINEEILLKQRFESFAAIAKIGHVGYAFKSTLSEDVVLQVMMGFVDKIPHASLKFTLISDTRSWTGRFHLGQRLKQGGKNFTVYDRGSERYIFWVGKGRKYSE